MKACAAVLTEFNRPLDLREIAAPVLGAGQLLVEILAAGVCGSDVHMWRGKDPRTPLPIILGHEGVGRVVDVRGPRCDVYGAPVSPGDRIIWERGVACGRCYACAVLHQPSLCENRWAYGIHRSLHDEPHLNGCYASHIILDARTDLVPLLPDDDPSLLVAASCSGATAAHTFDLVETRVGDTVVVFDLSKGRGADLVIEASGSISAAEEGLDLVRRGGALALVGFGTPVGAMSLLPFEQVVQRNVQFQGVWVSDLRHLLRAMSVLRAYANDLSGLVTRRCSLAQATEALEAVESRRALKVVLVPSGSDD